MKKHQLWYYFYEQEVWTIISSSYSPIDFQFPQIKNAIVTGQKYRIANPLLFVLIGGVSVIGRRDGMVYGSWLNKPITGGGHRPETLWTPLTIEASESNMAMENKRHLWINSSSCVWSITILKYIVWLVVEPTPVKNMEVNWHDSIPNTWKKKTCSKPRTRQVNQVPFSAMFNIKLLVYQTACNGGYPLVK